jgi:hypothetical protein
MMMQMETISAPKAMVHHAWQLARSAALSSAIINRPPAATVILGPHTCFYDMTLGVTGVIQA